MPSSPSSTAPIDPGLVLKITPPKLRKSVVVRERLRELRAHGEDVAVFLVEAPAGFGKTSLLAQWRLDGLQAGVCAAWLSLDGADTPVTVISGIVHGLRRSNGKPAFCHDALEAVRRGADTEAAVTSLLAEISEAGQSVVLTFDNCERAQDAAVLEVFDYLLHNLTPNLQIVMGSRPPCPIRTTDLLSQARLCRITANELRLDLPETIRLLKARLGDRIDADQCARLHEATEGWPLGLQLAAATLEQSANPSAAIAGFSGSGDEAIRRLFDGMLDALPSRLSGFLVQCSLVSPLHPSLCEAVADEEDAALLLQQLLVETPLLTAAEESDWFRLHPLAREYLQARALRALAPEVRTTIHRRACQWLAHRGYTERAAQHAFEAGDRAEALALVAGVLDEQLRLGHAGIIMSWLGRIPPAEIQANPMLRLVAVLLRSMSDAPQEAWADATLLAGDAGIDEVIRQDAILAQGLVCGYNDDIDKAVELFRLINPATASERARRSLANVDGFVAMQAGYTERARQIFQSRVPDDGVEPVARMWAETCMVQTYLWEGRPAFAEEFLQRRYAAWEARLGRRDPLLSQMAADLAACCWMLDQREEAQALLAHRIDAVEWGGGPIPIVYAYWTVAMLANAAGDEPRAIAYLERLAEIGAQRSVPRFLVASFAERIRLYAGRSMETETAHLLRQIDKVLETHAVCDMLKPLLRLKRALAQGYVALVVGDPAVASAALAEALTISTQSNRGYETVQILALQALLADRAGQPAGPLLQQALLKAESGGLVRVFADTLPAVLDLVLRHADLEILEPVSRGFFARVIAAGGVQVAEPKKAASSAAGRGILTTKEEHVLRLVAGGLPNKRIATEMGLSAETVKWHVKKLFTKLNAGSREHAVDRARLLGLLS